MQYYQGLATSLYYTLVGIIVGQFVVLMARNVTLLPLWTLLEYMQLVALLPLQNFKLIPYIYDAFKPMLASHAILLDTTSSFSAMDSDFFNINH